MNTILVEIFWYNVNVENYGFLSQKIFTIRWTSLHRWTSPVDFSAKLLL